MRLPAPVVGPWPLRHGWLITWALVAAAAVVVWVLAFVPLGLQSNVDSGNALGHEAGAPALNPQEQAVFDSLLSSVVKPGSVMHLTWSNENTGDIEYEAWIDGAGGKARVEERIAGELDSIEVVEGNTVYHYIMGGSDVFEDEPVGRLTQAYQNVLPYLTAFASASDITLTADNVMGRDVSRIETTRAVPSADKGSLCTGTVSLLLDSQTNLPVRSEANRSCPGGDSEVVQAINYSPGEFLPTLGLGEGFFSGKNVEALFLERQLERAREMDFSVFELADAQAIGLTLKHAEVDRKANGLPAVEFIYTSSDREGPWLPDLTILQAAAKTIPAQSCEAPSVLEKVRIRGVDGYLCSGMSTGVLLQLDGTDVYLYAMGHYDELGADSNPFNDRAGLEQAAEALGLLR